MQGGADLIIGTSAEWHEYYLNPEDQNGSIVHGVEKVNTPMNASGGTPTQAGGVWDVRDTEGDKSIVHLDWQNGAGQLSLDSEKSVAARFLSSKGFDIHRQGELSLLREKVDTHKDNVTGPIFSALGKLWLGQAEVTSTGLLKYSSDGGANWSNATINGTVPTSTITDFTTDGQHVYFCVPTGAETGVWRNNVDSGGLTVDDPANFRKLSAAGSTNKIYKIAYQSGIIFCSTVTNAGLLKVSDNSYDAVTPSFLNANNTAVALCAAGNAVYWVVSQGGQTFVYEIAYDPDLQTATTKQLSELTGGFVATCAWGYLGYVYVGGYFLSATPSVGRGAVFVCNTNTGETQPLVEIGEFPEETPVPSSIENDNRIYSLCTSSRDLYILTNYDCWRWDLDNGGYSHVFDHIGSGVAGLTSSYNEGSTISWDGENKYIITVHPSPFPSAWVVDGDATQDDYVAAHWTGKWTSTNGTAYYTGTNPQTWTVTPTGTEVLSNSNGTTLKLHSSVGNRTGDIWLTIRDGTKEATIVFGQTWVYLAQYYYPEHYGEYQIWDDDERVWYTETGWHLHNSGTKYYPWDTLPDSNYRIWSGADYKGYNLGGNGAFLASLHLHGNWAVMLNGSDQEVAGMGTSYLKDTATKEISMSWANATNVDSLWLNSQGLVSSVASSSYLFHPSITLHNGKPHSVYSDPLGAKSLTISNISVANPSVITTTANHGLDTGQVVYISGTSTTTSPVGGINGNVVATKINDTTFSVPFNVTVGNTSGSVQYNHLVGWTTLGTTFVEEATLRTSHSSFHSGGLLKKFKSVEVVHDQLPEGTTLTVQSVIDGTSSNLTGASTTTKTIIPINVEGYGIDNTVQVTCSGTANLRIKSVTVLWDFVRPKTHKYSLDCRPGVASGRWKENPEEAISFLFENSQTTLQIEDRFSGLYSGVIDAIEYKQAPRSLTENANGTVIIQVREVE